MISTRKLFKNNNANTAAKYLALGAGAGALAYGIYNSYKNPDIAPQTETIEHEKSLKKAILNTTNEIKKIDDDSAILRNKYRSLGCTGRTPGDCENIQRELDSLENKKLGEVQKLNNYKRRLGHLHKAIK